MLKDKISNFNDAVIARKFKRSTLDRKFRMVRRAIKKVDYQISQADCDAYHAAARRWGHERKSLIIKEAI